MRNGHALAALSCYLVLLGTGSEAKRSIPCSDMSSSCGRCISAKCVFAYVTMESDEEASQMPPRYLPHGCVSEEVDDMELEKLKRMPSWELSTTKRVLQGLVRVANDYDTHIAFITEDTKGLCGIVVDPNKDRLPGKTGQERITAVIKTAMARYDQMKRRMTPIQRARDSSTWLSHIFDDEIDAACDELIRMAPEERHAMGLHERIMPALDLLPDSQEVGAYMLARQVRRLLGYIAESSGMLDPAKDKAFGRIVAAGRLAMEVSCRYLTCLTDAGSVVVYDDLVGSDGKQLGDGLGLPCRYCRRLGNQYRDPAPAVIKHARTLVNGPCAAMRQFADSGEDNEAAACLSSIGQSFVHTLIAVSNAMDDPSGQDNTALDTAVTTLTMKIMDTGTCRIKTGNLGHWARRTSSDYEKSLEKKHKKLADTLSLVKTSVELQQWRSKGVQQKVSPELYPAVDLSEE